MKKLVLIALLAGGLAFASARSSDAQISVGIGPVGIGWGGYYGYYPYGYYQPYPYYGYYYGPSYYYGGHRYYRHYRHRYYYGY